MGLGSRKLFYVRDSGGSFTNLQVYAYRRSLEEWSAIRHEHAALGRFDGELRERSVFAVCALCLSLGQLLGQNNPHPLRSRTPAPKALFRSVAAELQLDPTLQPRFERLIDFYDAARHFGISEDDAKYDAILALDFETVSAFFETGVEVWFGVIAAFGENPSTRLDDFDPRVHPPDGFERFWPELEE